MRLKGGKLLLDLSSESLVDEPKLSLTQEEINCILSKGLQIKFKTIVGSNEYTIIKEVLFNQFNDDDTLDSTYFFKDATENEYYVELNLNTNELLVITY